MHTHNIFEYHEPWKSGVAASLALHGVLVVAAALGGYYAGMHGENWGGSVTGESMSATLVSSAIPLPSQPNEQKNVLANESKGKAESEPVKETKPEPDAVPIPDKTTKPVKEKPKPQIKTQTTPKPVERADNVIPYGQGGAASQPYSMVKTAMGTGGLSMGQDGAFGSRYSWYVDAVRRKVSENWFKYEVDPSITTANRVYITFDIQRNGQPANIQVSQSSGVPSLDYSAKRALQRIDTFGPLPNDYGGSKVSVEFWFDYKR
jgi:protein TonB